MSKNTKIALGVVVVIFLGLMIFLTMPGEEEEQFKVEIFQERYQVMPGSNNPLEVKAISSAAQPGKYTYKWKADSGIIKGTGKKIVWQAPDTTGKYKIKVIVTNQEGNSSDDYTEIMVTKKIDPSKGGTGPGEIDVTKMQQLIMAGKPLPQEMAAKLPPQTVKLNDVKVWKPSICLNDSTIIEMDATDEKGQKLEYAWSWTNPHDGQRYYNSGRVAEFGGVKKPGKYTVVAWVYSETGVPITRRFQVEVRGDCDAMKQKKEKLAAGFQFHHDVMTMKPKYMFLAEPSRVKGVTITQCHWNFGDGQTKITQDLHVEHTYKFEDQDALEKELQDDNVRRVVTLTVTGSNGQTAKTSHALWIQTDHKCSQVARVYVKDKREKCDENGCEIEFNLQNTCAKKAMVRFLEISHYNKEGLHKAFSKDKNAPKGEAFYKAGQNPKDFKYFAGSVTLDDTEIEPGQKVSGHISLDKNSLKEGTDMVLFRFQSGDEKTGTKSDDPNAKWYDHADVPIYITDKMKPPAYGTYTPKFGETPAMHPDGEFGK